jgi:glycerate dehydrogenase
VTNKTPISAEVIEKTNIQYIGLFSTGYNIIDISAAVKKGIVVSNVPDYSSNAVSQFVFALLLNLCHKIQMHSDLVFQGEWIQQTNFCFWRYPQMELKGKTIGIIGYGSIGKKVARIAFAFDMKVLIYTRTPQKDRTIINSYLT